MKAFVGGCVIGLVCFMVVVGAVSRSDEKGIKPSPRAMTPAQVRAATEACQAAGWRAGIASVERGEWIDQYVVCMGDKAADR